MQSGVRKHNGQREISDNTGGSRWSCAVLDRRIFDVNISEYAAALQTFLFKNIGQTADASCIRLLRENNPLKTSKEKYGDGEIHSFEKNKYLKKVW